MKNQTLLETNPYLQEPAVRKKLIDRSVRTSGEVEGIVVKAGNKEVEIQVRTEKRIFKNGMLSRRIAK